MYSDQYPYRELHDEMLSGRGFRAKHLDNWLSRYLDEVERLVNFGREIGPRDPASDAQLCQLYALSRVIQLLTLRFQPGDAEDPLWTDLEISLSDFTTFSRNLGLTAINPPQFHPIDCEIVDVTESPDPNEAASVLNVHWPALWLGNLVVCRAGLSLRAGAKVLDPSIATTSTLFWAYRRKARQHADLSHGWGSNSQWRTRFRRDYRVGNDFYFNVDGEHDLGHLTLAPDELLPLTREERVELLTHRCFVVTNKPDIDLWPYDDCLFLSG